MRTLIRVYALAALLVTPGCGESAMDALSESPAKTAVEVAPMPSAPPPMAGSPAASAMMGGSADTDRGDYPGMMGMVAGAAARQTIPENAPAFPGETIAAFPEGEAPAAMPRRIIYNAEIALVVEDFEATEEAITRLVQDSGGYIADLNLSGSPGSRRGARWQVRVPVDRFEEFLRAVVRLGELETNRRTSQDVTEQYHDLEARIRNKQVEERRLIEILEQTTGKLEEVLKVETELSRVRGEVEQLEGRLRLLENLTALTTVTIQVRERERFEPPPPVAPDFPTQVARTFQESLAALQDLGKAVVLLAVAWALWLPLILVGGLIGVLLLRAVLRILFRMGRRAWEAARPSPTTP